MSTGFYLAMQKETELNILPAHWLLNDTVFIECISLHLAL